MDEPAQSIYPYCPVGCQKSIVAVTSRYRQRLRGVASGVATAPGVIGRVATIWPRPDIGVLQAGPVALTTERTTNRTAEAADETAEDASHSGKYRQLWQWLQDQGRDEISLTFADVEQVLGIPLPNSARRHPTHWYGYEGTALGRAIRDAGWRASQVNLTDETVLFIRDALRSPDENGS